MSESYDFNKLLPPTDRLEQARKGLCDANVIAEIMASLGAGDISGGNAICGTMLDFLSERLKASLEAIEEGARL